MTSCTQPGFSMAAVPMLTRAHPVDSARSREASSRCRRNISTLMSKLADDLGEQFGVAPPAEGRVQVNQVAATPRRRTARRAAASKGSP